MQYLMLIFIFVLFVIHNLYYTRINANGYDFRTEPLWESSVYPCNDTFESINLNVILMIPKKRLMWYMWNTLEIEQGQLFKKLKEGYKSVTTYIYLYQLHDEVIPCKRFESNDNLKFPGESMHYYFNYDWLWYQVKYCAFPNSELRFPSSENWRNLLMIFHEWVPFYDNVKRTVLPTDRLPSPVYGSDLPNLLVERGLHPLFVVLSNNVEQWLAVVTRLQIPAREVIAIRPKHEADDILRATNSLMCSSYRHPSNDFLLNYYDRLDFPRYHDVYEKIASEYPVYFIMLAPWFLHKKVFDLFETDLIYYHGWSAFYLVLKKRFPNSRLATLSYDPRHNADASCAGMSNFVKLDELYNEMYPRPLFHSWDTAVRNNRFRTVAECFERMMSKDTHDMQKRFVMFIAFDYKERFYDDPDTIKNNEDDTAFYYNHYIAEFLYYMNSVTSQTLYVVAEMSDEKTIREKKNGLEHMLEYGYHKATSLIGPSSTYATMLQGILNCMEFMLHRFMQNDKISERMKAWKWPEKLKHKIYLNILIQFPQKLPMEIVPSLPQFFNDDYSLFKNIFRQQFKPENIKIAASRFKNFDGEKYDTKYNNRCRLLKRLDRNLRYPIELFYNLIVGYKKDIYANHPYKQTYNCAKDFDQWIDTPKETTLNIIIAIIDTLPIENFDFITEGKEPTEDPTDSHIWRKYLDVVKDKYIIYVPAPSLTEQNPTEVQYLSYLPVEIYKADEWPAFHSVLVDAIFTVAYKMIFRAL